MDRLVNEISDSMSDPIENNRTARNDTHILLKRNDKKNIKFKKTLVTPTLDIETTFIELNSEPGDKTTQANVVANLDPSLFTFKPKLNAKSEILAQNLVSFNQSKNDRVRKKKTVVGDSKCALFIDFIDNPDRNFR
jgi:hypothetical protein